jgi:hypothetical protein
MPTLNITVTRAWTQLAAGSDAGFLASSTDVGYIEYATTATSGAPAAELQGHVVPQMQLVGRGLLGPGHVWARVLPPDASSVVAVSRA